MPDKAVRYYHSDFIGPVKPNTRTLEGMRELLGRRKAAEYEEFLKAVELQMPFYGRHFTYRPHIERSLPAGLVRAAEEVVGRLYGKDTIVDPAMCDLIPMTTTANAKQARTER